MQIHTLWLTKAWLLILYGRLTSAAATVFISISKQKTVTFIFVLWSSGMVATYTVLSCLFLWPKVTPVTNIYWVVIIMA